MLEDMTIQEIEFELIRRSSFNNFDGEKVVFDLLNHSELWRGVVMDREGYGGINLIKLRDIEQNEWNVDTLYILEKPGKEKEMYKLAETWDADEISILSKDEANRALGSYGRDYTVMRVWWD